MLILSFPVYRFDSRQVAAIRSPEHAFPVASWDPEHTFPMLDHPCPDAAKLSPMACQSAIVHELDENEP